MPTCRYHCFRLSFAREPWVVTVILPERLFRRWFGSWEDARDWAVGYERGRRAPQG